MQHTIILNICLCSGPLVAGSCPPWSVALVHLSTGAATAATAGIGNVLNVPLMAETRMSQRVYTTAIGSNKDDDFHNMKMFLSIGVHYVFE